MNVMKHGQNTYLIRMMILGSTYARIVTGIVAQDRIFYTGIAFPIGNMEGRLHYTLRNGDNYLNIARDLSFTNCKNEEITTRDGHVKGYLVDVSVLSTSAGLLASAAIPNTWRMRNAFRKFHFAREGMFDAAGVTKEERGKYGQTIRPHFSPNSKEQGYAIPQVLDIKDTSVSPAARSMTGGEWTYSTLASSPTVKDTQLAKDTDLALVDEWDLTVLGESQSNDEYDGVKVWTSVGMIHAYNTDRQAPIPDSDGTTYPGSSIQALNNPLASLMTQTLTSGEIAEIAKEQEEEKAPYDIANIGDSIDAVYDLNAYMAATGEAATRRLGRIFVPAGLCYFLWSGTTNNCVLDLNVVGTVLCKEMA